MPFYDAAAQDAALDALWGAGHAASMPDSFEVGLLDGDPADAGEELPLEGGYARITCPNDDTTWLPSADGEKATVPLAFPDPDDAWSADASYWGIYVDGVLWDYGALADDLTVDGPGAGPLLTITRYFDTETPQD